MLRSTLLAASLVLLSGFSAMADTALNQLRYIRTTQGSQAALGSAQQLVSLAPANAAYRFELGVIKAELGDCREAWQHFQRAMSLMPLENVRRARDLAMADLCPKLAPWEGTFSLGIIADNNYNNMTNAETITIGGLPFTLSPDSRAQERYGLDISGSIAYNHPIGTGHYIVPSLSGRLVLLDVMEDSQLTLTPGLAYRNQNGKADWNIGPAFSFTFDQEGTVSQSVGIQSSLRYVLSNQTTLGLTANAWNIDARNNRDDGENYTLGMSWTHLTQNGRVVTASLNGTRKERGLDQDSQTIIGIGLGYRGQLNNNMGFDLNANLSRLTSDGPHPFFGVNREDTIASISAAVSFAQFDTRLGRPYIGVTYTHADSTIPLNDYQKTSFQFGISRSF